MSLSSPRPEKSESRRRVTYGLRWKIVAWSFIPTTVFLVAVAVLAYVAYQLVTESMLVGRNQDLVRLSARQLSSELHGYSELLEASARTPSLLGGSPQKSQAVLEAQTNRLLVFGAGVLLLDNFGELQASIPYDRERIGSDLSNYQFYREVVSTQETAFTDLLAEGSESEDFVTIAVPVTDVDGQILGVLAGTFKVDPSSSSALFGSIVKLQLSDEGTTFVVDSKGRVIYHDNPEYIGDDLSYHEPVLRVESGESGAKRTKGLDNTEILASFATIPGTGWGLVLEENWRDVLQEGLQYRNPILALLALGLIIPAIVVAFGVRRITGPIQELVSASARVGRGEFDQFIDVQTGDEIEELADQFNIMSHALQDSYAYLEQRVEERTRELSVLLSAIREASSTLDLDQVLNHITNALVEATNAQHCAIYLFDEDEQLFKPTSASSSPDTGSGELGEVYGQRPLDPRHDAFIAEMIARQEPIVSFETANDERLETFVPKRLGINSLLAVPFIVKDRILAAAVIASTEDSDQFEPGQIQLAGGIANTAAIAIENAYLFQEVDLRMREVQALYRADEQLYQELSVDRIFTSLLDIAHDILNVDKSCILVYIPERERLQVQAARGFSKEILDRMVFEPGDGIAGQVLIDREPVFIDAVEQHPQVDRAITGPENIDAFAHLPIMIGDTIFGIFNLSYSNKHVFTDSERRIAAALAQRSALIIENARLYEAEKRQLKDTERRRRVAEGLQEILSVLNTPQPLGEIFDHIVPLAVQLLDAEGGALHEFDQGKMLARTRATYGMPAGYEAIGTFPITDSEADRTTLEGRYYTAPDLHTYILEAGSNLESIDPNSWLALVANEFNAFLSVPLLVEGDVFGGITLFYREPQTFSDEDVQLALNFARQTALAIENAQLRDRMQRTAVLEERSRLARDLHDSVTQTLFSATLIADVLPRLWDQNEEAGLKRLQELRELTRGALAEMRTLLLELRPKALLEAPLPELLEQLSESIVGRARIPVNLDIQGACPLSDDTKVALYRIAQEALNNIVKHSNASSAWIKLICQRGQVLLSIRDDGLGFDPENVSSDHLGINIMEERAEQAGISLDIMTSHENGTEVTAVWMDGEEEVQNE
jgi:nitrate/nitrite-specific signal transduction histidine kinase/putative methionine-R-sulfoxide reductase with GAF domain